MKQPHRTRKYKMSFYILICLNLVLCASFFLGSKVEKKINNEIEQMKDGIDYFADIVVIDDKKEVYEWIDRFSVSFNFKYSKRYTYYYLISSENKILTEQQIYDTVSIGDKIIIYTTKDGQSYTSLIRTKRELIKNGLEFQFLLAMILPTIGLLMFIYSIVLRKKFVNPYYKGA